VSERSSDPRDQFRLLYAYLGSYLYEDWMCDFRDPWEAFAQFLRDAGESDLQGFRADVADVLSMNDVQLVAAVDRLSRNLNPRAYGWDEREWLTALRDQAREELKRRSAPPEAKES
jgi:hypothetical protein